MIAIKSRMNKHESRSTIGAFLVFPALTQINLQQLAPQEDRQLQVCESLVHQLRVWFSVVSQKAI